MNHLDHLSRRAAVLLASAMLSMSAAAAPTLLIDDTGRLTGARGIEIGTERFDVRFVDGSFVGLFGDATGLDATTAIAAQTFSQALADQVFGDGGVFDTNSGLINGCSNAWRPYCYIYTPYQDNVGQQLNVAYLLNRNGQDVDTVGFTAAGRWTDTGTYFPAGDYVYADWSASLDQPGGGNVPEPASAALVALALAGLATSCRSRVTVSGRC